MRRSPQSLFDFMATGLEATIRDANPWWRGEQLFGLPPMRRWAFESVHQGLKKGLTPAVVLRGPRQIGKTTLLAQVIDQLLMEGIAPIESFAFSSTTCRAFGESRPRLSSSVAGSLTESWGNHSTRQPMMENRHSLFWMRCRICRIGLRRSSIWWT